MGLLDLLARLIGSDKRYGGLYLHSRSDSELESVREEVRQKLCSGSEKAYYDLERIDQIIDARRPKQKNNESFSTHHTEHGWYLSEDDD